MTRLRAFLERLHLREFLTPPLRVHVLEKPDYPPPPPPPPPPAKTPDEDTVTMPRWLLRFLLSDESGVRVDRESDPGADGGGWGW